MKKRTDVYIKAALYGSFGIWLVITLIATLTHEPWQDEVYAWQISKFSIPDIFYEMRYEGHFALWSLILAPFSHAGLPLATLGIVAWALNAAAIFYLLVKSPFPFWSKIAIMLTTPFLYVNPAISRCYVLIPLLLFLFADVFLKTQADDAFSGNDDGYICSGVLLALIANTHIYSEGFAGIVGLILLCQTIRDWKKLTDKAKRNRIIAFIIALSGALIAFLQILPSLFYSAIFTSGKSYVGSPAQFLGFAGSKIVMVYIAVVIAVICVYILKKDIIAAIILAVSNLFMVAICIFVYAPLGIINRELMWVYFVIFALWIVEKKNTGSSDNKQLKIPSAGILILLLSVALFQPARNITDFKNPYFCEADFAHFIENTLDSETPLYNNPNPWCCVMMEYLPEYKFYNVKDGSKLVPRADREPLKQEDAEQYISSLFKDNPQADVLYVVDCVRKENGSAMNFMESYSLPFEYDVLYPQTEEQKQYYRQYYLLEVHRPGKEDE